jgi:TetR/AcrR family transcriptional regulator, cholesterol catabolism regulator
VGIPRVAKGALASDVRDGPEPLRPEGRLREIVDHAADLFDQRGYHMVTMQEVAQQVGLRKPTLYHYVPSKAELLFLIHREFMDLVIARYQSREGIPMTATQRLLEVMNDILELMHTHRGHVRVFFEHYRELPEKYREQITNQRDAYEKLVAGVFQEGIATGEFRQVDVRLATLALFGMCNWAYQWYKREGPLRTRDIAFVFWNIMINGISANPFPAAPEGQLGSLA